MLRAHIGVGDQIHKWLNVVLYRDPGTESPSPEQVQASILGTVMLDEDNFLGGMYHLFPQGTLDYCDETVPASYSGLVEALEASRDALKRLGGDPETLTKVENALRAAGK